MEIDHKGDGILKSSGDIVGYGRDVKATKDFATEKHRIKQLDDKFDALMNLAPDCTQLDEASAIEDAIKYLNEQKMNLEETSRTQPDRASMIGDVIKYISMVIRVLEEHPILVERKRCNSKKKSEDDSTLDVESINIEKELTCHLNSRM